VGDQIVGTRNALKFESGFFNAVVVLRKEEFEYTVGRDTQQSALAHVGMPRAKGWVNLVFISILILRPDCRAIGCVDLAGG
jgi:hypothetical protein